MQCPICGSFEHSSLNVESGQLSEQLMQCTICDSSWAVSHGLAEVVVDTQKSSFLEGQSECVEADDYPWATYSHAV